MSGEINGAVPFILFVFPFDDDDDDEEEEDEEDLSTTFLFFIVDEVVGVESRGEGIKRFGA